MIGRADIEGSKSNVAVNAWLPQASYPCGNFSDTSSWTVFTSKGSIGHAFTAYICTENENQASFSPFSPHKISVLIELTLGHLRYHLTDVPPQPNSLPDTLLCASSWTLPCLLAFHWQGMWFSRPWFPVTRHYHGKTLAYHQSLRLASNSR